MPSWGNTDSLADKPHWSENRQIRPFATLTTANTTNLGNTVIKTTDAGLTPLANLGIVAGMSVYATANVSTTGEKEFFVSNTVISSVNANNIVLTAAVFGSLAAGSTLEIGIPIDYATSTKATANVFADTIIITGNAIQNRIANGVFAGTAADATDHAVAHVGWNKVKTFTGNRAGRVQVETLVALSNVVTSNITSGNTSNSSTFFRQY